MFSQSNEAAHLAADSKHVLIKVNQTWAKVIYHYCCEWLQCLVWPQPAMQLVTKIPTPCVSCTSWGGGLCTSNAVLLATTRVSLTNGISFHPMALARV